MGDAAENLPEIEPLLTVEEVAPLLRVKPKTVYRMIEEGSLDGAGVMRLGHRIRFRRSALVAFLAGQEGARKRRSP